MPAVRIFRFALLSVLLVLASAFCWAQKDAGTIVGTVTIRAAQSYPALSSR